MNRTKDELLLECIKQFEHIENVLGYNRLATTRSLINEINQALTIPAIVGESEQLKPNSITDKEYNDLMKALYPKDNRKR